MVSSRQDKIVDLFVVIMLLIVGLIALFPLLYVFSMSLTPMEEVAKNGGFLIIPRKITLEAYSYLFVEKSMPRAMGVTTFITLIGGAFSLTLTTLMAYPLSRKKLFGRGIIIIFIIFTMLFSGGMIPTFLLVKKLGLLNSYAALILPSAISSFNVLVMKSFFESLPEELFESARIDGAKEFKVLLRIVLPLSLPVMMTVGLFYMVSYWNMYFSAILYISDVKKHTLQVILRNMLFTSTSSMEVEETIPTATFQMASVIFASIPIIAVYPFIQKYFTQGMMLGAVKG